MAGPWAQPASRRSRLWESPVLTRGPRFTTTCFISFTADCGSDPPGPRDVRPSRSSPQSVAGVWANTNPFSPPLEAPGVDLETFGAGSNVHSRVRVGPLCVARVRESRNATWVRMDSISRDPVNLRGASGQADGTRRHHLGARPPRRRGPIVSSSRNGRTAGGRRSHLRDPGRAQGVNSNPVGAAGIRQ